MGKASLIQNKNVDDYMKYIPISIENKTRLRSVFDLFVLSEWAISAPIMPMLW